jgi:signal transduction histidine kinase
VREAVVVARPAAAALAVVAGVGAVALAHAHPEYAFAGASTWRAALELAAGWGLATAGIATWLLRPRARSGPLLVLAAVAWFAVEAANPASGSSPLFTLGLLIGAVWPAVLFHAATVYTGVRAWSLVAAGYVATLGLLGAAVTAVTDPTAGGCGFCPQNLLYLGGGRAAPTVTRIGLLAVAAWAAAVVLVIAVRMVAAAPARRLRAALLVTAAVAAALVGADALHGVSRGFASNDGTDRALWTVEAFTLLAAAAGIAYERVRVARTRRELGRLVADLDFMATRTLREALAGALGDPAIELLYARDEGGWLRPDGHPAEPPPGATRLATGGRVVAALAHRPGLLDDPALVDQVAAVARLGLEHERLQAELRAQLAELRASRARVVATGDAERRRLERDLHDGAQQRLVTLALSVALARRTAAADAAPGLVAAEAHLQAALERLRAVARGISPAILEHEGLAAAVEALAEEEPRLRLGELPAQRLAVPVESAAYHVVAEILRRAPQTPIAASARVDDGRLVLELEPAPDDPLVDLEDRVGALDGRLIARAGGLRVELPCGS